MAIFTLTEKANSDLKDIARFTQKRWGHDQRNKYLKDLDACFFRLAENPSLGR
ncbi:MAG: type II toxin-antitoxin system RelE/ParE family toxin, partial [Deltaproteobacteria bacterium]|nr:type II toxin-antitoxin system RelE/ParE family toxin [Deltaproteobacteria bacterium]